MEYADGHKAVISANNISNNLFTEVDQYGNRFVLYNEIIDHRKDETELREDDAFIHMSNGNERLQETTEGWEICIQRKDGSSTCKQVKYFKESYPVKMAEYAVEKKVATKPSFAWWIKHVLRKKDRIISKTASK